MPELRQLDTIAAVREELDRAPQMKLRFAAAIADLLAAYNLRATGSVLGSLSIASSDELDKIGVKPGHARASQWTI